MAYWRPIKLNYCAECKQIDKAVLSNCRWLQFSFCRLACFKRFFAKIAIECDLCRKQFDLNNRVHLRDDVSKHVENSYKFTCEQCFDRRLALAVRCYYCHTICYKGFGAKLMTITGLIEKYRCSTDCCLTTSLKCKQRTKCSECDDISQCDRISYNGQMHTICSAICLENFAKKINISIGPLF